MMTLLQNYDLEFEKLELLVQNPSKGIISNVEKQIFNNGFLKFNENSLIVATLEIQDDTNIMTNTVFNLNNISSFRTFTKTED